MITLALFGDRHLHSRSPRYAHVQEVWDEAISDAVVQGATDFIGLGDVCEATPNGDENWVLGALYRRMLEYGRVAEVLGNHEAYDALRWLRHLGVTLAWDEIISYWLPSPEAPEALVLLVPYPRRGHAPFDELASDGTIQGTMAAAAERITTAVKNDALAAAAHGVPLLVVGHFTVQSMRVSHTEFELHSASEVIVPVQGLMDARLVAVGHIHAQQEVDVLSALLPHRKTGDLAEWAPKVLPQILGVGSLIRQAFDEADDPKTYTLVRVDGGQVTWERRPLIARAMAVHRVAWRDLKAQLADGIAPFGDVTGKEVKVTIDIDEDELATYDGHVVRQLEAMAPHVVVERAVKTADRVRAPDIQHGAGLQDQFTAYLRATNQDVSAHRLAALHAKLETLL